ncbi:MAG: D-alanyl-D-alanine carboxypeptidase [Clostridia bacterium]|nr:D-alanyl-D-alanine carboxypeptidase [Clostridia bacterium]
MSRMFRFSEKALLFVLLLSFIMTICPPVSAAEDDDIFPTLEHAKSAYLLNIENDIEIFKENVNEKVYPTATVKMMVGLIALEQLGDRLDEKVTITSKMLRDVMGNNIGLKAGEIVSYGDLIAATLVGGANDAATCLAIAIDGNLTSFLSRMNARAVSLGALSTNYANASGMHDDSMYTTCADTAKIALEAYKNSRFMEYCTMEKFVMPATNISSERTIHNKNALLTRALVSKYYYKLARGMSSGFTKQGGYSLVTTASYEGATYLCVVMGAEYDEDEDIIYSYSEAVKLLRYAFSHYGYRNIIEEGKIVAEMPVSLSDDVDHVPCVASSTVSCYMPYDLDIDFAVEKTVRLESASVEAPVEKGQHLGMATVIYEDQIVGNVDLVAGSDVQRSEFLYILERIKAFSSSRFFKGTVISAVILFIVYVIVNSVTRFKKGRRRS